MTKDLLVLTVSVEMSGYDIARMTAEADTVARRDNTPWMFAIDGFNSDSRELWEIPEALDLIDRLDEVGFASVLDSHATPESFQRPLLDAFRFWLMRTRQMKTAMRLDRELAMRFYEWLKESNQRCDSNTLLVTNEANP